jgi:uracil-DNA glycosylase family protein
VNSQVDIHSASDLACGKSSLNKLRNISLLCKGCDLWKRGKQTVFGEGPSKAKVMLVGEQPGFQEDIEGKPFVGPAGKLLDKALEEAGIFREKVYLTNVVKHFKWSLKGKRHMHEKPNAAEILACRPWLETEISLIKPKVIVCLGATAARALIRKDFKVTQERGKLIKTDLPHYFLGTIHPSSILRTPDEKMRHLELKQFIKDLKKVSEFSN